MDADKLHAVSKSDDAHETTLAAATLRRPAAGLADQRMLRRIVLEVVEGEQAGTVFRSEEARVALGSHPSNALILADPTVSRFHLELTVSADGVRIRDLASRNGTFVDGVRVFDALLHEGARVRLGGVVLRFASGEQDLQIALSKQVRFGDLLGESEAMRGVFDLLARCASSDSTILIEGETGTGKEGAAEAIHTESARKDRPFVVVDCGAIPVNLIESELFGHEKGAFTGAASRHLGAFEQADGGTIVLDEIGELPTDLQPKLLRVLEQKTIRRLGGSERRSVDVRIVAATNRDLRHEVNEGRFRSDLYYRLSVVKVVLPPLRERLLDLPILTRSLLERMGANESQLARFSAPEMIERLSHGHWPGNVRELRNYLERCLVLDTAAPVGEIEAKPSPAAPMAAAPDVDLSLSYPEARRRALSIFEHAYLSALLDKHGGNVSQAAREAGVERVYLHRLLRRSELRGGKP